MRQGARNADSYSGSRLQGATTRRYAGVASSVGKRPLEGQWQDDMRHAVVP
ncbi:hypothetical protein J2X64_000463 [Phycicoccus sp. 3266]|nr:hypothetical protein [Phycicoccus sp. 3266]